MGCHTLRAGFQLPYPSNVSLIKDRLGYGAMQRQIQALATVPASFEGPTALPSPHKPNRLRQFLDISHSRPATPSLSAQGHGNHNSICLGRRHLQRYG